MISKETLTQIISSLTQYNKWRRGADDVEHPDPKELGITIENAVKFLEQQQEIIIKMKAGLEFYAWGKHYKLDSFHYPCLEDKGEFATKILDKYAEGKL